MVAINAKSTSGTTTAIECELSSTVRDFKGLIEAATSTPASTQVDNIIKYPFNHVMDCVLCGFVLVLTATLTNSELSFREEYLLMTLLSKSPGSLMEVTLSYESHGVSAEPVQYSSRLNCTLTFLF